MTRGRTRRLLLGVAAAAMLGLLLVGSASALVTRPVKHEFGNDGTAGTTFEGLGVLAIHQADKRLYVPSQNPNGIFGFDISIPGTYTPLAAFNPLITINPSGLPGLGVDNSGVPGHDGNVYLSSENTNKVYGYDSTGAPLPGYGGTAGINPTVTPGGPSGEPADICGGAVDAAGNFWISNYSTAYVIEYDPSGNYVRSISVAGLSEGARPCQLAFDQSNGEMYVGNYSNSTVWRLSAPAYDTATAVKIDPHPGSNPFEYSDGIGVDASTHHVFVSHPESIAEYEPDGTLVGEFGQNLPNASLRGVAIDEATNEIFVGSYPNVRVFGAPTIVPDVTTGGSSNIDRTTADVSGTVDPAGGGNVTECLIETGPEFSFGGFKYTDTTPCADSLPISSAGEITGHLAGLKAQQKYHYRFKVGNANGVNYGKDQEFTTPVAVKSVQTLEPTDTGLENATLHGSFDRDGYTTHYYFQWSPEISFFTNEPEYNEIEQSAPAPGPVAGADTVDLPITGLKHGRTYYYRLVATNEFGTTIGPNKSFYTSAGPVLLDDRVFVSEVSTDQATIHLTGNPNGEMTTYHIEYGTAGDCASSPCTSVPDPEIVLGTGVLDADNTFQLTGLEPATVYHYRVYLTNKKGIATDVSDHTFRTFAHNVIPPGCPNSLARQQTGAALLLDCRAFELVSAGNTGGYDVESSLAPGETPYGGYPYASGRVLYGIHNGAVPGVPGVPTNKGIDPYVATRSDDGWTTKYVGIPADGTPSIAPFASTLLAADPGLDTFAFGGPNLCAPCFSNGATGIPMRLTDGPLVQGMAGQSDPGAAAAPDGLVTKVFSGDGSHFVFGSQLAYQPDGNDDTGDVSIYDRNLSTGVTQVVSKTPAGTNLPCLQGAGACHSPGDTDGIAELDISGDGSRIVVGQLVSQDSAGNDYFHLYMHIGTDSHTVDLTPGTTAGAHFDGMSSDGSAVYFTTRDPLTTAGSQDTDNSADLFRAAVGQGGAMTLTRVSTGTGSGEGSGNYDGCDPSGDSASPDNWNAVPGGPADCSVVAIGGGGGVAAGDGTVYFLSPEKLDGGGTAGAPNLFVARPGSAPEFVATMASNANLAFPPKEHLVEYESTGFAIPAGAAFDHANGEYYVLDNTWAYPFYENEHPTAFVQKFEASGHVDQSFGAAGRLDGSASPTGGFRELGKIEGNAGWAAPNSVAVDNTCADQHLTGAACTSLDPSNGDLYVPDRGNNVVDKFDSDGNYISQIDVTEIVGTVNIQVNGAEVDPATGKVFVEVTGGGVMIYGNEVDNAFTGKTIPTEIANASDIAIDSAGNAYVITSSFSPAFVVKKFAPPYTDPPTIFAGNGAVGLAYDPITDHIFIDKGDHVEEYTTEGAQVGPGFGFGTLDESYGLDAYDGRVVVSNKGPSHNDGKFIVFTAPQIRPDARYDSPLVIDSVNSADVRHSEDFQVTPDGDTSVFGSALALTAYKPGTHSELYRFDQPGQDLVCVSCPSTNASATGDGTLASNGLNVTEDGRVFFTATEPLVLRDTNGKEDVYEWNDGDVQPVSPGSDQFGSRLLTVSADGTDAYFFTHATLAPQDHSGGQAKIYDAREDGGFFVVPAQPPCVASDECHGAGSTAAPPPDIGSYGGTPTGVKTSPPSHACHKGKVRRHGHCVSRHHKRHATRKHG